MYSRRSRTSCSRRLESSRYSRVLAFAAPWCWRKNGFIDRINDSVGLGFGVDYTRDNTWLPLVMQWNFWLSEHWSVFGEPGYRVQVRRSR